MTLDASLDIWTRADCDWRALARLFADSIRVYELGFYDAAAEIRTGAIWQWWGDKPSDGNNEIFRGRLSFRVLRRLMQESKRKKAARHTSNGVCVRQRRERKSISLINRIWLLWVREQRRDIFKYLPLDFFIGSPPTICIYRRQTVNYGTQQPRKCEIHSEILRYESWGYLFFFLPTRSLFLFMLWSLSISPFIFSKG